MSQFRIKKIDVGLPDEWDYRINDVGLIEGSDIVAEDPNELADALSETQDLILHATVYAPTALIDSAHGALERIKLLEDNIGALTLQDAYDEGRSITVTAGRNLILGSSGAIELDSSHNLKMSPSTMKIYNGSSEMNFTYNSITSQTVDLTFGTTGGSKNALFRSHNNFYLKDGYLLTNIALSESGQTALDTTSQSLVGAINELNASSSATTFQQVYAQSNPPELTTTFILGAVRFVNGTGDPATPALRLTGGMDGASFVDTDELRVGPGAVVNLTIASDGSIDTNNEIKTSTKVTTPRIENLVSDVDFEDSRGSCTLSDIGAISLDTTSQSLFGGINEVNTIAIANATNIGFLDIEHNLTSGYHEIINTQSPAGQESTSRLNIKNSSSVTQISMNALGTITAGEITLGGYTLTTELLANETHRNGDGTDHSGVSGHIAADDVHGVTGVVVGTNGAQVLDSKTLTSSIISTPTINGTVSGTAIKDEDTMVSDSDQHLATQQSIKGYVDSVDFLSLADTISSFNVGRVLFESSAAVVDSPNLIWNSASNRLGINTTTPDEALDVTGNAKISGSVSSASISTTSDIDVGGVVKVSGTQVLTNQQVAIADVSALTTTETATGAYTANEQDMLNNLKADVTEIHSKVDTILAMLRAHGIIAT